MAHLAAFLPSEIEQGAVRHLDWGTEVVTTDGGHEVRNNRWSTPLRTFEVSFPTARRNDAIYTAVVGLFDQACGNLHSFNFRDWTQGGEVIAVRFDSPLAIQGIDRNLDHIETLTLREVRQ